MKKLMIRTFILFLLIISGSFAQKSSIKQGFAGKQVVVKSPIQIIDSLKNEIQYAKTDKNKIKLIIETAEHFLNISADSSLIYANKGIILAEKIDADILIAKFHTIIAKAYGKKRLWEDAKTNIENAKAIFEKLNDAEGIGQYYLVMGNYNYSQKNYDLATTFYAKAIDIFKNERKPDLEIEVLISQGGLLIRQSKNDSAITILKKAVDLSKKFNNIHFFIVANMELANLYSNISEYELSNNHNFQVLEKAQEINDLDRIARITNNIGINYDIQSKYEEALFYYRESLEISEKLNNKRSVALKLGNIGAVYMSLGDYNKALDNFKNAALILESTNYKDILQNIYGNTGILYDKMGKPKSALEYYFKTIKIAEEIDDKNSLAMGYGNIGNTYNGMGEYKSALEYLYKAVDLAKITGNKLNMIANYMSIGNVYSIKSEYDNALKYYNLSLELAESIGVDRSISLAQSAIGNQNLLIAQSNPDSSSKIENINKAINYLEKAEKGTRDRNELDDLRKTLQILSDAYKYKENYRKSLDLYIEATALRDSIYNIETKKKISEMEAVKNLLIREKENEILKNETKLMESELKIRNQALNNLSNIRKIQQLEIEKQHFDIAKQNQELNLLNKEKEIKELELIQKDIESKRKADEINLLNKKIEYEALVRNFMFVSVILLTALAFLLFVFFRRKKKDNKLLEEKNLLIEQSNLELEQLNDNLVENQRELTRTNIILDAQKIELEKYSHGLEAIVDERTKELVVAMEEIQKSNKLKTEIIANMNHEIRTPLNFIKGSAALIRMLSMANNPDEELIDTIDSLNQGVTRLNKTMELFADLSALKSGNYKPNIQPMNLNSILEHHYLVYNKEIAEQNKPIKINLNSSVDDIYIEADETSVHQTLGFIINNAVKFTDDGSIKIEISENNNKYLVKIEDTGIGMSEEYQSKVFEPFSQEDMSATRKYEGIGLSLALAYEYSKYNNFTIDFESKQGVGTKFTLSFNKYDINFDD